MKKSKRLKYRDEFGNKYRFTPDELNAAWNIIDRVDKIETASLYLRNVCDLNADDYSMDEWWICCATLCQLYAERFNGGGNDEIWKAACNEFMELRKRGEVI